MTLVAWSSILLLGAVAVWGVSPRAVRSLVLWALAARLVVGLWLSVAAVESNVAAQHQGVAHGVLVGDGYGYVENARRIVHHWAVGDTVRPGHTEAFTHGRYVREGTGSVSELMTRYDWFAAWCFWWLGVEPLGLIWLSSLAGAATVGVVERMSRTASVSAPGRLAAHCAAWWPSTFFWSIQPMREAFLLLAVACGLWLVAAAWSRSPSWRWLLVGSLLLGVGSILRDVPSLVAWADTKRHWRQLDAASALGLADGMSPLVRWLTLPAGTVLAWLMPFPWQVTGSWQAWLGSVESCGMLILFWMAWRGARHSRGGWRLLLAVGLAVLGAGLWVFEGNLGTLFRHRSVFLPLVWLLAAGGCDAADRVRWVLVARRWRHRVGLGVSVA